MKVSAARFGPPLAATRPRGARLLEADSPKLGPPSGLQEPRPLAQVERDLAVGDSAIVCGAVFELLRTGRLHAPSLHQYPLGLHLMIGPAS